MDILVSTSQYRRYQPRGENKVRYQHEYRTDQSAGTEGRHEGQTNTSVDPDTSSFPSKLVLHLSDLSAYKPFSKLIYLEGLPYRCKTLSQEEAL